MRKIENFKEKLIIIPAFLLMYILLFITKQTCIIRMIVGFPCPFCGMTRAVLSLLRLDFATAFYYHPMVWALPILVLYYLYDGRLINEKRINIAVLSLTLLGFVVTWVLRLLEILPSP